MRSRFRQLIVGRGASPSRVKMMGSGILLALGIAVSLAAAQKGKASIPLSQAKILIELNATAQDAGIQMLIDGEGWDRVTIYSPDGHKRLMTIKASGSVGTIGVTELFFESAEPSLDELPLEELLAMFPEGEYRIVGRTVEGDTLTGTAILNHDIPAAPSIVMPAEEAVTDENNTVIAWEPVTEPEGIQIRGYQVIVEQEEPLRVFSVDLPATVTTVTVSPEFLLPDTEYKLEVIAVSENNNQTITESTFSTAQ
jgi:hypothetical protein